MRALLAEPGLVARSNFRPSRYSVMLARRQVLSEGERRDALDLARDTPQEGLERLAPERQRAVLDTAAELFAYRKKEERENRIWIAKTPDEKDTIFTYDAAGRMTSKTEGHGLHVETYEYDQNGNLTHFRLDDADTFRAYNGHEQLLRITDANGVMTLYAYLADQRLSTTVVDPNPAFGVLSETRDQ